MAPRRPRSTSNVSASNNITRAPTASPQLKKQFVLALDSIYQNNLNVIKRRDPTIVSILDQFSHVCLYNFNGKMKKWDRLGFEGSIFIVEHSDAPVYGFYILNRLGTGDYSRRIHPEDDIEIAGNYLMYRYYPDFTSKRIQLNLPFPIPPRYRAAFDQEFARDHSLPDDAPQEQAHPDKCRKGTSVTLGLWQFPQDGRIETLKDVMLRLHEYVKHGLPYPEQYRYGPGRPPPPPPNAPDAMSGALMNGPTRDLGPAALATNGSAEVDKLFAKLQPSSSSTSAPGASTSSISVQSLFDALTGQGSSRPPMAAPPTTVTPSNAMAAPPPGSTRGLALLDSIFASVTPSQHPNDAMNNYPPSNQHPVQPHQLPSHPEDIQIVSPKPQSSALPHILTQNAVSTLLGLGPKSGGSRASSAALSSGSSRRSGNIRYEGDNELSENDAASEGDGSAPNTALLSDPAILSKGPAHLGIPPSLYTQQNGSTSGSLQGDVTPRAPARGIGSNSPMPATHRQSQSVLSVTSLLNAAAATNPPSTTASTTSVTTVATSGTNPHPGAADAAERARSLVPFSADSELWPYPRAPLNDNDISSDADVVELDFSDTRALSDPSLFKEKQAKQGKKGDRKKKSRKEKAAERQKERDAIENGWDDPTKGEVTINGTTTVNGTGATNGQPLSLSALMESAKSEQAKLNGSHTESIGTAPSPPAVQTNGTHGGAASPKDIAREALLGALSTHPRAPARDLSRKQFVQEVLTLLYSDNSFVDRLYEEYMGSGQ